MSAKQAEELVIELADVVEDLEASLMYPEAIPETLLKPLCADLGLAIERLTKHAEAVAKAERAGRGRPVLKLAGQPPTADDGG
jgi:hypothetical protein